MANIGSELGSIGIIKTVLAEVVLDADVGILCICLSVMSCLVLSAKQIMHVLFV